MDYCSHSWGQVTFMKKEVLNNTPGIKPAVVPGRVCQGEASLQRNTTVHQQLAEEQRRMAWRASRRAAGWHPRWPTGRAKCLRFQLEGSWGVAKREGTSLPCGLLGRLAHGALSCSLQGSKSCFVSNIFTLPCIHSSHLQECSWFYSRRTDTNVCGHRLSW